MENHRIRILHISDLHERGPHEGEPWSKRRIFGPAWQENLKALLDDGLFDLVCFTGDAAQSGDAEEYKTATDFFLDVLDRLHVPRERFFLIPGNHDIQRKTGKAAWRNLRKQLGNGADVQRVSSWINGHGDPPPGVKASWREPILARLDNYRAWVRDADKGLGLAAQAENPMGYRTSVPDLPLHIIGLNTAWLCGDDSDATRLLLTSNQIGRHVAADGEGFKLVLIHHPLHELQDRAEARRLLADFGAGLVLRGHLHEPEVETSIDPDRQLRQAAAGCLYEGGKKDQWPNSCQAITIAMDAKGRASRINVHFRTWSKNGHWHDDGSQYAGAATGHLTWRVATPTVHKSGTNPYHPWLASVADFVGRRDILRRLELALDRAHGVSIVGDGNTGKSLLLSAWKERVEEEGRTVRLVSGKGGAGKSVGAFVEAITGHVSGDDADAAANVLEVWISTERPRGKVPLVLVDDADGLVKKFDCRFFERIHGMLGEAAFVFVSGQQLEELFEAAGNRSPLAEGVEIQRLGLLETEEAEELIARGAPQFPSGGAEAMRRWAGGHPYFLQAFGHFLVESRAVDAATLQLRIDAEPRLKALWRSLNDRERLAIKAGPPIRRQSLIHRGLVTLGGNVFGEVFSKWIEEES